MNSEAGKFPSAGEGGPAHIFPGEMVWGAVMRLCWVVVIVAFVDGIHAARAHDPGLSVAEAEARERTIELVTSFAPADAGLKPPRDADHENKSGGVRPMKSSMEAVVAFPSLKTGSAMMARCRGMVVLMPRIRYSLSARYMRSSAVLRFDP
jgi:hypothetical protein